MDGCKILFLIFFTRKTLLGNGSLSKETGSIPPLASINESSSVSVSSENGSRVPKSQTVSAELTYSSVDSVPVLPPPPSFKSVTFAPGVNDDGSVPSIPMEGLPVGPAKDKQKEDK